MNALTKRETRDVNNEQKASRSFLLPRVNIAEAPDAYLLEAEMPGVTKDDLEILLEENELTIVGKRQVEPMDAELVYRESLVRDFRRVFEIDPTIDASKIEARIENGVLKLNLPKAERVKPRKIAVS